jgi:hypothetical protein
MYLSWFGFKIKGFIFFLQSAKVFLFVYVFLDLGWCLTKNDANFSNSNSAFSISRSTTKVTGVISNKDYFFVSQYSLRLLIRFDLSDKSLWFGKWFTTYYIPCKPVSLSYFIPYDDCYHLKLNIELIVDVYFHYGRVYITRFTNSELFPGPNKYV